MISGASRDGCAYSVFINADIMLCSDMPVQVQYARTSRRGYYNKHPAPGTCRQIRRNEN